MNWVNPGAGLEAGLPEVSNSVRWNEEPNILGDNFYIQFTGNMVEFLGRKINFFNTRASEPAEFQE